MRPGNHLPLHTASHPTTPTTPSSLHNASRPASTPLDSQDASAQTVPAKIPAHLVLIAYMLRQVCLVAVVSPPLYLIWLGKKLDTKVAAGIAVGLNAAGAYILSGFDWTDLPWRILYAAGEYPPAQTIFPLIAYGYFSFTCAAVMHAVLPVLPEETTGITFLKIFVCYLAGLGLMLFSGSYGLILLRKLEVLTDAWLASLWKFGGWEGDPPNDAQEGPGMANTNASAPRINVEETREPSRWIPPSARLDNGLDIASTILPPSITVVINTSSVRKPRQDQSPHQIRSRLRKQHDLQTRLDHRMRKQHDLQTRLDHHTSKKKSFGLKLTGDEATYVPEKSTSLKPDCQESHRLMTAFKYLEGLHFSNAGIYRIGCKLLRTIIKLYPQGSWKTRVRYYLAVSRVLWHVSGLAVVTASLWCIILQDLVLMLLLSPSALYYAYLPEDRSHISMRVFTALLVNTMPALYLAFQVWPNQSTWIGRRQCKMASQKTL